MISMPSFAHPILSCSEAGALERRLFAGDEAAEWAAMRQAGAAVATAALRDSEEIVGLPRNAHLLIIVGKGHNGGDALIAAQEILQVQPLAVAEVLLVYGVKGLRPLALRAWQELQHAFPLRVKAVTLRSIKAGFDLMIDGLFGYNYRPPLDRRARLVLRVVNALTARMRVAVDLPSGLTDKDAFRADFTYVTGIIKAPLLDLPNAGRLRYLDLGFFKSTATSANRVLTSDVLMPLQGWRDPSADKRTQGHLFVVGGSRSYSGAVLMTVLAALRSGAGLVTAFVPESLVPAFAARAPEAIWVGWPETANGGLALEGQSELIKRQDRATALVIGPGMGRDKETLALARDVVTAAKIPVLIDADALQPEIVRAGRTPRVLTPHAGEFGRIAGQVTLGNYAQKTGATVVLKGPVTRIAHDRTVFHSCFGGPVLARGGSGDLLAGIIGSQLALTPQDPLAAVCRGVVWHGRAADALARARGAVAVRTTEVLDFMGEALRE
jgi:NAD(P)H-hydrate epimerase